jgi:Ca-activated chloride channel family protein
MLSVLKSNDDAACIAILITDGYPTDVKGKPLTDLAPLIDISNRFAKSRIELSAVGLGDAESFNTSFLVELADKARGAFIYADTPPKLSQLLVDRLSASQNVINDDSSIELDLDPGVLVNGVCRISPNYVPLEAFGSDSKYHIEIGALRRDETTRILVDMDVPAPANNVDNMTVGEMIWRSVEASSSPLIAQLVNTSSYTQAQSRCASVEKDRLKWEMNLYSTELNKTRDPRKTAWLLDNIERTAHKADQPGVAADAAQQIADLRKTGKLTPHRVTGLLVGARSSGGSR